MNKFSIATTLDALLDGECRLDAGFYATDVARAKTVFTKFADTGGSVGKIGDLSSGTFNPPPIKRIFADQDNGGTPYMLPQEMYDFYWHARKFVLADKMPNIEDWFLKDGWVVLSQSGTVGKPYLATSADEAVVLSQNAIRIPPKSSGDGGFIYAYLSTWIGQSLLRKDKFGITVKHIRPHHVDSVPVPLIDPKKRRRIGAKVSKAFELRAEAIKLLNEAKAAIYRELNAPHSIDDAAEDIEEDAD